MELPAIMASLQLEDSTLTSEKLQESDTVRMKNMNNSMDNNEQLPRLRKRSYTSLLSGCVAKKKCNLKTMNPQTDKEIKNFYLKQKLKLKRTKLETIFEEPKESASGEPITMSAGKQTRTLNFNVTKAKKTKRKTMIKERLLGRSKQVSKKAFRVSTADVLAKLTEIMDGDKVTEDLSST